VQASYQGLVRLDEDGFGLCWLAGMPLAVDDMAAAEWGLHCMCVRTS
jgi:hypothetical protein